MEISKKNKKKIMDSIQEAFSKSSQEILGKYSDCPPDMWPYDERKNYDLLCNFDYKVRKTVERTLNQE